MKWSRIVSGTYRSKCGSAKVWLGGDEAWYGEANGMMSRGFPYKKSAQQWCERQIVKGVESK